MTVEQNSIANLTMHSRIFLVAGFLSFWSSGWAQGAPPALTVALAGTNQLSITITNAVSGGNYEVWQAPVLGNSANYPWAKAAAGAGGQTNFIVNTGGYQAAFFRVVQINRTGAHTPFVSYEAESGTLGGGATVQSLTASPTSSFPIPSTQEASGEAYVVLNATGQSVTLVNNTGQKITALNLRYSIPDAAGGGGITATLDLYVDGVFQQAVNLNSVQSWWYETANNNGSNEDPTSGSPHLFFDETHFFISGAGVAPGSTITFQKDSTNTAAFYWLDVVDVEAPPAALTPPANSLSILNYGAVSNNASFDSTAAIQRCINAAQSQGKTVWIPPGTYYLNSSPAGLTATGITIQGAGLWYSEIYANQPTTSASPNILRPTSCTVKDLAFDSSAVSNDSTDPHVNGLNVKGSNWVLSRLWIQHMGAGIWADGSHGLVTDCRTGSTWADGININNGSGEYGSYLTVSNCFVRGSGDDGLAINDGGGSSPPMTNAAVVNCTSVAPRWANNIGIYGGLNLLVSNNLCADSVTEFGISIGQFGTNGPFRSGTVVNNTVVHGGCYKDPSAIRVGQTANITNALVANNIISNALYAGMDLVHCGQNVTVANNTIWASATTGVLIPGGSAGSALLQSNTVHKVKAGQAAYLNSASGTFTATQTGNNWQGVVFYQNAQYGGGASQVIPKGTYTMAQLAALGVTNDAVSSLSDLNGWTVTLYANDNFSGTSWTLTGDMPDFNTLNPSANDAMSSCKIQ